MDNSLHLPAFINLTNHLKRFSNSEVLKGVWGVIELSRGDAEPSLETNKEVEKWQDVTINRTEILLATALTELNQLIRMASPIDLEKLYNIVTDAREDVTKALHRSKIEESINSYNENPDKKYLWTWVPDNEDDEDYVEGWGGENVYTITDEDFILKQEYLDSYVESIIEVHILPDFYSLTERVFRLFRVSQKADHIFGVDNFEGKIISPEKFNEVIKELQRRKILTQKDGEVYWKGIDRSNLGSAAAFARYLEKANIIGDFGSMNKTRLMYCTKLNISQVDQKEWNKKYNPDDMQFSVTNGKVSYADYFWDQLGFIFDIE